MYLKSICCSPRDTITKYCNLFSRFYLFVIWFKILDSKLPPSGFKGLHPNVVELWWKIFIKILFLVDSKIRFNLHSTRVVSMLLENILEKTMSCGFKVIFLFFLTLDSCFVYFYSRPKFVISTTLILSNHYFTFSNYLNNIFILFCSTKSQLFILRIISSRKY